jgi:hypothetical protein
MSAHSVTILARSFPLKYLEKLKTSGTSVGTANKVCVSLFSTRCIRNICRSHKYLASYAKKPMYNEFYHLVKNAVSSVESQRRALLATCFMVVSCLVYSLTLKKRRMTFNGLQ